jgi:hypothetical protein
LLAMFMIPIALMAISLVAMLNAFKLNLLFNVMLGVLVSFLALILDVVLFRVYMSARQEHTDIS